MIVAVQGTTDFDDYSIFLRAMSVAMSGMSDDDRDFIIYSIGPARVNSFVAEFSNLSERGMKARGKRIRYHRVPSQWIDENMDVVNYFAFLSKPNHKYSPLVDRAESLNIEVGIFQY